MLCSLRVQLSLFACGLDRIVILGSKSSLPGEGGQTADFPPSPMLRHAIALLAMGNTNASDVPIAEYDSIRWT